MAISYRPDGSLIYASPYTGLLLFSREQLQRAAAADKGVRPEIFTHRDGLTSEHANALLRDAEGSLWVGTAAGLDRFRPSLFVPFASERKASLHSVCANDRDEVWIANQGAGVYRVAGGKTALVADPGGGVSNLFCGNDGQIWLATHKGGYNVQDERVTALPPIPGHDSFGLMQALVATSDRRLFARIGGSGSGGIWKFEQGQ